MARFLFAGSLITALDTNGDPASGAKMYFYDTGTTDLVSIYTAVSGPTTHTNPVVADSAGRFADIFLDCDVVYRSKLTNAAGSDTIWDVDPIDQSAVSSDVALYSVLAGNGGAALIGTADGDTVQEVIDGLFQGLFTDFAGTPPAIPLACLRMSTQGYGALGVGAAWYNYDGTVNGTYVTANPLISFLDSLGRGWKLDLTQTLTAQMFGAVMDGGTDDLDSINAAIEYVHDAGGGDLWFLAGTYYHSDVLVMQEDVILRGAGMEVTILESDHTGDGMKMTSPINSSTGVNTAVYDLQFLNANGSNTGGGYVDVGGTYVYLFNVHARGFKYGIIFDQTELATIRQCQLTQSITGGVWLVNGAEHTVGADGGYTNRINIEECQFNLGAGVIGIIDDGYAEHCFRNNNFNGCLNSIRAAGVNALEIACNELEGSAGPTILFSNLSRAGNVVGACTNVMVESNYQISASGQSAISCVSGPAQLTVNNNLFGNNAAAKIAGLNNVALFNEQGNGNQGGTYLSGTPTNQFRDSDYGTATPTVSFGGGSTGVTYSEQFLSWRRFGNVVYYAVKITLTSKGSSTGSFKINGLPYPSIGTFDQGAAPQACQNIVTATQVGGRISAGSTAISLFSAVTNPGADLNDTHISNNSWFGITGHYFTA